jgi:hypothetical protein
MLNPHHRTAVLGILKQIPIFVREPNPSDSRSEPVAAAISRSFPTSTQTRPSNQEGNLLQDFTNTTVTLFSHYFGVFDGT